MYAAASTSSEVVAHRCKIVKKNVREYQLEKGGGKVLRSKRRADSNGENWEGGGGRRKQALTTGPEESNGCKKKSRGRDSTTTP